MLNFDNFGENHVFQILKRIKKPLSYIIYPSIVPKTLQDIFSLIRENTLGVKRP